jgi:hypothetical protein
MAEEEKGVKWWLRHVLVPILGGGGIIALFVSVREHPSPRETPSPTPQIEKEEKKEVVSFFLSTPNKAHEEKEADVSYLREKSYIHWNVINPRGKLFLRTTPVSGSSNLSKELPESGLQSLSPSETEDYSLEEEYPPGHWKTLASVRLRVSQPF